MLLLHAITCLLLSYAVLAEGAAVNTTNETSVEEIEKPGRCPTNVLDKSFCPDDIIDQCHNDMDCHGSGKCCSTGCAKVCINPLSSGCDLSRENDIRRGRSLGIDIIGLELPQCNSDGTFANVQCTSNKCYCVDPYTGYERPGTRGRSIEQVNCSRLSQCAGHQCRMLCSFGFELDEEGCPICQCRDPCKNIMCPGSTTCIMEEVACSGQPCPTLPSCKQARSLSSFCPLGDPWMVDESSQRPFLCGHEEEKPKCPPFYKCHAEKGMDFGVCCANVDELVKPGVCPIEGQSVTIDTNSSSEASEVRCGANCEHDLQCPSTQKCCMSSVCGQHCVQPNNLTNCLQQRMISELIIVSERAGKGYVPQCRESDGLFEAKQCSRNGLVCWCVHADGKQIPKSMGPAKEVVCGMDPPEARTDSCSQETQCSTSCEYGYAVDDNGCTTCDCEQPCHQLICSSGSECVMKADDSCSQQSECPQIPICVPRADQIITNSVTRRIDEDIPEEQSLTTKSSVSKPKCPLNKEPLTVGDEVSVCKTGMPCPLGYTCIPSDVHETPSVCCLDDNIIDDTKPGQCPFIQSADNEICLNDNRCYGDSACKGDQKCCVVADCGYPVCVDAIEEKNYTADHSLLQGPTMCEYLRDLVQLEGVSLALPTPSCDSNGAYEPVQCNNLGQCWCVDDFGSAIPETKASTRELVQCESLRLSLTCSEPICRLGCDYGFVLDPDSACPICECRDPCKNVDCGLLHECQMIDVPCIDGVCPPIPQCVPSQHQREIVMKCPKGESFKIRSSNISLACSPRARALECPNGFACVADENSIEGICCPTSKTSKKPGQCPYLMPAASESCDLECSEDAHCEGDAKCCSNGCGTYCSQPIAMTTCQHQRALLEYRAREAGFPAEKVYLPECSNDGEFLPKQCHPGTLTCWCVDPQGAEVAGTRVSSPAEPNCQQPIVCPAMNCNLACLHGYQLDARGCPICACRDPCEEVTCSSPSEECRIVHVACVGDPCPPLPVCLPKLENPCQTGTPLTTNGSIIECGPQGKACPSSHKCHLSPLGEYALCCPKPREVCFNEKDSGDCEGSIQRWSFNPIANRCEKFRYGGCGGNLNNFESRDECENACPILTSCQRIRQKNIRQAEKDKKITFMPKCDKLSGSWLPEQCLEELGVCWCVSDNGDQIPGSLTRGAPTCNKSSRTARLLNIDPSKPTNMICEPGQTVHVCDRSMCENKVCLSHPGAICRVNPCNGCNIQFVDAFNAPVNCEVGLTDCQKQLQKVINSAAFERPNRILIDYPLPTLPLPTPNVNYDVDLSRNVDVYYANTPEARNNDNRDDFMSLRDGRKLKDKSVQIQHSSDAEADTILRSKRTTKQSSLPESPLTESQLTDPQDITESQRIEETFMDNNRFPFDSFKDPMPKPGTCPSTTADFSLLQCNPTQDCTIDSDCPADSKCCFTGCGTMCLQPKETPASLGMTLEAPQCHSDGSWVREQRSGDLAWCVDAKGRPLHDTVTKGHVRCGPNGQILEQMSLGYVCPRGIRPRVCTDECLNAVCVDHADAVCIADPCNQCKVSFYKPTGEKVICEDKCSQTLTTGMCRASFKRFFFNSTAKMCQEFIYGGCQGNDNNFSSMDECQNECGDTVLTCDQPVKSGHCSDGEAKWYYNKSTKKCELFWYSGCGGNDNNFATKDACENTCPDLILCPYWSASSMEPKPCSRSSACSNQTCHGYPNTICKVDPCTCSAHFYNKDGERVSCMMPTESPKTRLSFTFEEDSSSLKNEILTPNSGKKSGPITIFLEGEPTLTRCELLQRHLRQSNSRRYVAQCDDMGRFVPTQCYSTPFIESFVPTLVDKSNANENTIEFKSIRTPNCWCVDEIGRKTQPTIYFKKGERTCDIVSVESVVVTLGFRGKEVGMEKLGQKKGKEIKKQVSILLKQLRAETMEEEINVIDLPDLTQVKFTLLGKNKVDVAYQLEDQVRRGGLALKVDKEKLPADLRASWFHHQVSEPRWNVPSQLATLSDKIIGGPREIVSKAVSLDPPYLAAAVIFTVLSAILICGLVVAVVLYRRHITGQYPKAPRGSLQSLAFSDSSLDRRSMMSNLSDQRRCSNGMMSPPHYTRRPTSVTTVEEEYRAGIH